LLNRKKFGALKLSPTSDRNETFWTKRMILDENQVVGMETMFHIQKRKRSPASIVAFR